MSDIQINNAIDIAKTLLEENPKLKYYEAIELAKEMILDEGQRSS